MRQIQRQPCRGSENICAQTGKSDQKWMRDEILQVMEERKKKKNDILEHNKINKAIKKREAKEEWWDHSMSRIQNFKPKEPHLKDDTTFNT